MLSKLGWMMWWKEAVGCLLTLLGTNISPKNGILKMIFLFPRWDVLISWRVKHNWSQLFPKYMLCEEKTAGQPDLTFGGWRIFGGNPYSVFFMVRNSYHPCMVNLVDFYETYRLIPPYMDAMGNGWVCFQTFKRSRNHFNKVTKIFKL